LNALKILITEGSLDGIPIENHLSLQSTEENFSISDKDILFRNEALNKMLSWMTHLESYFKKKFANIILANGTLMALDDFCAEYDRIVSRYMKKGLEVGIPNKPNYVEAEEITSPCELRMALDDGFHGKDILYFMTPLAEHGSNWKGLEKAPEGVNVFVDYLKKTMDNFVESNGLTREGFYTLMANESVLLAKKTILSGSLDTYFKNSIKELFLLTDENLSTVMNYIGSFFRDISNEIRVVDPSLNDGIYQDHITSYAVGTGSLGELLIEFLKPPSNETDSKQEEIVRFEAGRQLLLLFKGFIGIEHYQNEINKMHGSKLAVGVDNFFGAFTGQQTIELTNFRKKIVEIRKRNGATTLIDWRGPKSFASFLRKCFEERAGDVTDFHSITVINPNENVDLNFAESTIENFVEY